jgi:hypothetical protein
VNLNQKNCTETSARPAQSNCRRRNGRFFDDINTFSGKPAVFANRRQHFARFFDDISQIRAAVTRTIPGPSVLSRKSITLAYG